MRGTHFELLESQHGHLSACIAYSISGDSRAVCDPLL